MASPKKKTSAGKLKADGSLQTIPISQLHLDSENPRFGGHSVGKNAEANTVDQIIGQHGILDVISSMGANGYFESEPLIGAINKGHGSEVTIVEGNRRLTASLVLAGDQRAVKYEKLKAQHSRGASFTPGTHLPVQVYDWAKPDHRKKLLPYLGVRHIVGAQQWDSYAKAAWVAEAQKQTDISLSEIKVMIGDEQGFTDRIVEGYQIVNQVVDGNFYDPKNSKKSGRGSLQDFPFSWVYTSIGYKNTREYLNLPAEAQVEPEPLEASGVERAAKLFGFMFGSENHQPAINDSRQIGLLAKALGDAKAISVLDSGGTVSEALEETMPLDLRLENLVDSAERSLKRAIDVVSGVKNIEPKVLASITEKTESIDARLTNFMNILENFGRKRRKKR